MRWSPALFACALMACATLAWSQVLPRTAAAQTAGQQQNDEDCLEQEAAAARAAALTELVPGPRPIRGPLTAEMIDRVLEVAEEIEPATANRLRRLQTRDPAAFDRAMRTTGRSLLGMAELKARDPKLYGFKLQEMRIDEQVIKAGARLTEAIRSGSADVEQRREDLRMYVRIQVALSIKSRVEYLARLREHIVALEEGINRDALNFENTVEDRIQTLLDADGRATLATRRGERVPEE